MLDIERNKKYNDYLKHKIPKTHPWPTLFHAFWVGGLICLLGEIIKDLLMLGFNNMTIDEAGAWELIILIVLASILTGVGVYDRIGAYAGAGSIVPITGFSNSITSPAIEFRREGIIFGLCAKMFLISGPVIVLGIVASIIAGVINLIF
ncbi:MAG: SpoVA/SpoVAEb family sporulation membrane protein [Clostridia bacterium]|nr:SpoVA/SpoVAEb family sporulation membrane protein [Clostridia bacterium]